MVSEVGVATRMGAWPGGRSAAWRRVAPRHQRPRPDPAPPCRLPAPITWRPGGRPGCTGCPTAACACSLCQPLSTRGTPTTSRYGPRASCPPFPGLGSSIPPRSRRSFGSGLLGGALRAGGFAHRHKEAPAPCSDRFHPSCCRHKALFFPGRARLGPAVNPGTSGTPGTAEPQLQRIPVRGSAVRTPPIERCAVPALSIPGTARTRQCLPGSAPTLRRGNGDANGRRFLFPLVTVPWEAPPPSTPQRLFPESLCEPHGVPFPSAVAAFLRLGVRRLSRHQPPLPHHLPDLLLLLQAGPGARRQAAPLLLCHLDGCHRRACLLVRGAATVSRAAAHHFHARATPGQPRGLIPIPLPPSH